MRTILRLLCLAFVPLCTRAEQVVFSELMYQPQGKPQFIEIWNITYTPLDMANWRFTDGITYEFPAFAAASAQASFLKPQERIIVSSADETTTRAAYNIPANVRVFGPWSRRLDDAGERVTLTDKNGIRLCTVSYKDGGRWPKAADGTGHSLVLVNENRFIDDYRVWRASSAPDGSPGVADPAPSKSPLRLSEVHFTGNSVDWIELENTSIAPVDAAGLFISSSPDFGDKIPLSGNVPENGFASWPASFAADSGGDLTLYLSNASNVVLATAELKRRAGRDSIQAIYPVAVPTLPSYEYVRTDPEWYAATADTRDAANNPAINQDIVINEIMCDPPSGHEEGEFIELYNKGTETVSLAGWTIRGGIDFDFPPNASVPPGGYVVVTGNVQYLQQTYPNLTAFGNWSGKLGNNGDLIRIIDNTGNLADEVDYRIGGDWPTLAGGLGSSLELRNPALDNNRSSAWRDSDETNKTNFETYTVSGPYLQLNSQGSPTDFKELHLFLVGDSHAVVRNVTLRANGTGANVVTNGTVQSTNGSSATGWLMQGTHWASSVAASGEIDLIADGHGDNRANRAEIDCTGLVQNTNYTLQFEARWVSGIPRLIAQTWDHSIGKPFRLPIPNNLGTPGAANSALSAAAPPQVDSVLHSPAVPKATDPVRVTARVTSTTPLTSVEVVSRIDDLARARDTNGALVNPWVSSPMFDDGTNGDAVPNDGLYTATLTQYQTNGRIVQFYVRATANGGLTSQAPRSGAERPAMWIVDNRVLPTTLRRERFVISLYDRDALNTAPGQGLKFQYDFPRLSNHYFNCVFIHNEQDVYYNTELRKAGSPWTRADSNILDRGKWKMPADRVFRNRDKSSFDNDAANSTARHHNRLVRYWLYLFGHPANENEFANVVVNSDGVAIREDVEFVDNNLLDRCFPDGKDGELMRSDDEWWFTDTWAQTNRDADWSYKGTNSPVRYHTEWMARSREADYDYSSLIEFFKTVSNPSSTQEQVDRVLDPNLVLIMAAIRGYAYDWDSITLNRGKNGFFYRKTTDGRWMFLHWDSDLAFQDANNIVVGSRAGWSTYIGKPWNRRLFNYYLTEMLTKFSKNSPRVLAWFDAEEAASSAYTVNKALYTTWFTQREARIISEINGAFGGPGNSYTAPFAVTTPGGGTTTAPTIALAGTAPSSAFKVVVDGHPEISFRFLNQTTWNINGLVLANGPNTFTLHTVDMFGTILGTTTYTITESNNAVPLMQLVSNPASLNVALGEELVLDASTSVDPDAPATSLSFTWTDPANPGVQVTHPAAATAHAIFSQPGVYTFGVTGTDAGGGSTLVEREVLAFNIADFASMGNSTLESYWTLQNVEERDNFSGSAWYSTQDKPGTLLVQVLDDAAKPVAFPTPTHPVITRPLPPSNDFALQTDFFLDARQTGTFSTGLLLDTVESGAAVRYLFSLDGGTTFTVKRSTGGAFSNLASQTLGANAAVMRARRIGNQLLFQLRLNDVWQAPLATATLADGTTMDRGGIFVATSTAENVRVGFDYIVVADTSNTARILGGLRLTELMFHPAPPTPAEQAAMPGVNASDFEFIELANLGATPLNLGGASFASGVTFVFPPNFTLGSGGRTVIVANRAAFILRYGNGADIAGEFSGSLDNSGEQLRLVDAAGFEALHFTYSSQWYPPSDGDGYSLVTRSTMTDADSYENPGSWALSGQIGGTPGSGETSVSQTFEGWRHDYFTPAEELDPLISGLDANPDGDLRDNLSEYMFGTHPRQSAEPVTTELGTVVVDGVTYTAIRFNRPKQAVDLTFGVQTSTDLATWTPNGFLAGTPEDLGNGLEKATFAVTGLSQGHTTYHIRPIAFHASGSRFGDDLTFATSNTNPVATDKTVHAPPIAAPTVVYSASETSDVDGDPRTLAVLSYDGTGSVTSDGAQIMFINAGFAGTESVQVTVADGFGGSAMATITLRNDAPAATADQFTVGTGPAQLDVLSNDTDPDGDALTIFSVSASGDGTATTDGTTISYTPGASFGGTEQLAYVAGDQRGGQATGTVTIVADHSISRTVAVTNAQVPGMSGAVWTLFGAPSIFAQGTEAGWLGTIKMGATRLNGVFSGNVGAPVLRVRSDDPARDASGAALPQIRFKSFRQPVFAGENFAFIGTVTGAGVTGANGTGIWFGEGESLRMVAREGDAAAGTGGAKFKAFTSMAMPGAQNVFFIATLKPDRGVVSGANDVGLWTTTGLALREGQTLDLGQGPLVVKSFEVLANIKGSAAHGRYDATEQCVDALITFTNGASAIAAVHPDGSITLVAATGKTDDEGRTPLQFGPPSSPGGGELPVAITTFGGTGFGATNNVTIFDFEAKRVVAQKGTLAPGISGGVFDTFQDPVAGYGANGVRVNAFVGTVHGVSASANTGLWSETAGATPSLQLVARKGGTPPEAPGTKIKSFQAISLLEGRGPMFTAKLSSAGSRVTPANDQGLWATDSTGALHLVIREGDSINGKTVRTFRLLEAVPGSPGQRRSWTSGDAAGTVIYVAYFTDGSSAILTKTVP